MIDSLQETYSSLQEIYSRIAMTLPADSSLPLLNSERSQINTRKFLPKMQQFGFKDIMARPDETAGGKRVLKFLSIPIAYSLMRPAWSVIRETRNQANADEARKVLLVIQETIIDFQLLQFDLGYLPQLHAFNVDDGAILIEWIFDDFRIGFSIESEPKESSWYLVSNANSGEIAASGYISRIDIKTLALWLINFVLYHS